MRRRVLLIAPRENSCRETEMYPSGALVLIGSMLHQRGHEVSIVHMTADGVDAAGIAEKTRRFEPDIVGITMNTFQTRSARDVCRAIRGVDRHCLLVTGGPHPSALGLDLFKDFPELDVVVYGEGELTFLDIVQGGDLSEIKGICYNGRMNPPRPYAENLDHIPLPDLDLIGGLERFSAPDPVRVKPSMYIMASRGCPYQCTFCNKSVWGNRVRFRDPELVIREVQWLHEKYGVREIFFQDDTFNLNRAWAEKVLGLIVEKGMNRSILYRTPFRANEALLDEGLLDLARRANFWLIFYGVENGNQGMLDRMRKGLTVAEIERAFRLTHQAGIKTYASIMVGNPGETSQTVADSIELIRRINPSYGGAAVAIPFPGTEFREEVLEKGHLLEPNYDAYEPSCCVIRTDALSREEIIACHQRVNELFHGRGKKKRNRVFRFFRRQSRRVMKAFQRSPFRWNGKKSSRG
jgi:radical SAM superfamily enzyme YgiQ (UPF0313 family)